jgi:hypothetical protein
VDRIREIYDAYLWDDPTLVKARVSGALPELEMAITESTDSLAASIGRQSVARIASLLDLQPSVIQRAARSFLPTLGLPALESSESAVLGELTTAVIGGGTYFDRLFHGSRALKTKLAHTVQQGLLSGQDFNTVRSRLHRAFGVDKLVAPQGNAYGSVKAYANEARRQWNVLMGKTSRDLGGLAVWWAILDGPLARTTTPGCAARHGRPIHVLGYEPPIHTNCRCTVAVLPGETDLSVYHADADRWLRKQGLSRKEAMLEESDVV